MITSKQVDETYFTEIVFVPTILIPWFINRSRYQPMCVKSFNHCCIITKWVYIGISNCKTTKVNCTIHICSKNFFRYFDNVNWLTHILFEAQKSVKKQTKWLKTISFFINLYTQNQQLVKK